MKVDFSKLQSAIEDCKKLNDTKQQTYILLKFSGEGISVCYADNSISFIRKIEGYKEDGDAEASVIVEVKAFSSRLDLFKISGSIHLTPLQIRIVNDSLEMSATKYLVVAKYDENDELMLLDNGEVDTDSVEGALVSTSCRFFSVESNAKFAITARTPFDSIFQPDNDSDFAEVDKSEFIGTLERISKTIDTPICVISSNMKIAFAPGKSYTSMDNLGDTELTNISIVSSLATKVVDIFKKCDSDGLKIIKTANGNYIKISDDDDTVGVMVPNTKPKNADLATLKSFMDNPYELGRFQFNREVFDNIINSALLGMESGSASTAITMKYDPERERMILVADKKGAGSTSNDLCIIAENFDGDTAVLEGLTLNIVFKVLSQAISTFSKAVIEMRIGSVPNSPIKVIKIAEIDRDANHKTVAEHMTVFMCA